MYLMAQIIEVTLDALYDKGVIDLSDDTEEFQTECEIEYDLNQPHGVTIVSMCGWYVFIWWMYYGDGTKRLEAYHTMSMTFVECQGCGANTPANELKEIQGKNLCDSCRYVGMPQREITYFTVTNDYLPQTYCVRWLLTGHTDAQWFHDWTGREPRTEEVAKQDVLMVKREAVYVTPERFKTLEKVRQVEAGV
jgi:hypothetical protein